MCFATCLVLAQGVSLPYTSGFDSAIEKAGWQQYRTGFASLSNWTYSNFQPFSAPTCLSHDYNVGGSQADTVIDWFVVQILVSLQRINSSAGKGRLNR